MEPTTFLPVTPGPTSHYKQLNVTRLTQKFLVDILQFHCPWTQSELKGRPPYKNASRRCARRTESNQIIHLLLKIIHNQKTTLAGMTARTGTRENTALVGMTTLAGT